MAFFLAFLRLLFHSHIYFLGILLLNIHASSFKACFACFPKVLIGGEVGNSWLAASAMEKCGSLGEPPWQWIFAPWTQNFDWSKLKESWQRCSSGCFVLYEFLMILVRLWLLAWFWLDRSWRILDSKLWIPTSFVSRHVYQDLVATCAECALTLLEPLQSGRGYVHVVKLWVLRSGSRRLKCQGIHSSPVEHYL